MWKSSGWSAESPWRARSTRRPCSAASSSRPASFTRSFAARDAVDVHQPAHHRRDGDDDLVVAVHAVKVGAEALEHADHAEGHAADLDFAADRVLAGEERRAAVSPMSATRADPATAEASKSRPRDTRGATPLTIARTRRARARWRAPPWLTGALNVCTADPRRRSRALRAATASMSSSGEPRRSAARAAHQRAAAGLNQDDWAPKSWRTVRSMISCAPRRPPARRSGRRRRRSCRAS